MDAGITIWISAEEARVLRKYAEMEEAMEPIPALLAHRRPGILKMLGARVEARLLTPPGGVGARELARREQHWG